MPHGQCYEVSACHFWIFHLLCIGVDNWWGCQNAYL